MIHFLQKKLTRMRNHCMRRNGVPRIFFEEQYAAFPWAISTDQTQDVIAEYLEGPAPFLLARASNTEWNLMANVTERERTEHSWRRYLRGESVAWWWDDRWMYEMVNYSGFFPAEKPLFTRFAHELRATLPQIDVLAQWANLEYYYEQELQPKQRVALMALEPFFSPRPWTRALAGKKVLVIYPFAEQIEHMYRDKRHLLFDNPDMLPEFELKTLKSVQSLARTACGFDNWFEALASMEAQMDAIDYDIALVGAGAYGQLLAAHAKATGHKGLHLGGQVQFMFGLRGKRWDAQAARYGGIPNEHWEYPDPRYRIKNAADKEEGAVSYM